MSPGRSPTRRQIPTLQPQVAVLDSRLPDGSGVDVCREIRSRDPNIAVLILTSFDDDEALFAAIMAGAAGYVLKQIRGSDLIDSVRRVAAGQSLLDPAVTARVLERVRRGPDLNPALAPLTDQERRVLSLVGAGMTNRQIAESMFLAEKTEELRLQHAGQAGTATPHPGRAVRRQTPARIGPATRLSIDARTGIALLVFPVGVACLYLRMVQRTR